MPSFIAGLVGENKIAFPAGKGCRVFIDTIKNEFHKLKDGGGIEILRVDGKNLRVVPSPPGGYTVEECSTRPTDISGIESIGRSFSYSGGKIAYLKF